MEGARAALLAMGYCEARASSTLSAADAPVPPAQQRHPTPPTPPQQQRRPGAVPAGAGVGGGRYSDEEGDGAALVSNRGQAQQWRLEGGGLPGNAAVLGSDRWVSKRTSETAACC